MKYCGEGGMVEKDAPVGTAGFPRESEAVERWRWLGGPTEPPNILVVHLVGGEGILLLLLVDLFLGIIIGRCRRGATIVIRGGCGSGSRGDAGRASAVVQLCHRLAQAHRRDQKKCSQGWT